MLAFTEQEAAKKDAEIARLRGELKAEHHRAEKIAADRDDVRAELDRASSGNALMEEIIRLRAQILRESALALEGMNEYRAELAEVRANNTAFHSNARRDAETIAGLRAELAKLQAFRVAHDEVWARPTSDLMEWQDKAKRCEQAEAVARRDAETIAGLKEALEFAASFQITDSQNQEVTEDSLHEIRKTASATLANG